MNRIGITQRVDIVKHYGERRDCLDQRWSELILQMGYIPVPLPNIAPEKVAQLVEALQISAVILSGGNSIACLNTEAQDAAPERDAFENALIAIALEKKLAIVGICRGMQLLNLYMGGSLIETSGHVAVRHPLKRFPSDYTIAKEVNSYHNYGIPESRLGNTLIPLACDDDGNIEAFYREDIPLLGIMWHPEREEHFSKTDIQLLKRFLL
jgi:gamma-glutamyl-gamma-aminobutyrate hydrolase PuuD